MHKKASFALRVTDGRKLGARGGNMKGGKRNLKWRRGERMGSEILDL